MYDCIVFPSDSPHPIPYEKWREEAREYLPTASAGAAVPDQLSGLTFSVSGAPPGENLPNWKRFIAPDPDYVLTRVRQGLALYRNGGNVPDNLDIPFATALANTASFGDNSFQPVYHPLSDSDITEALSAMERNGEIRIEAGMIRFLS